MAFLINYITSLLTFEIQNFNFSLIDAFGGIFQKCFVLLLFVVYKINICEVTILGSSPVSVKKKANLQ